MVLRICVVNFKLKYKSIALAFAMGLHFYLYNY